MLAPDLRQLPALRPYLAARAQFAAGTDTPRDYLERCLAALDAWEPRIGAFVHLNIDGARAAADAATVRWRRRPAALADRRHAARHQGHHRDRSTCRPRTARRCCRLALRPRRRQRGGAARGRRRHPRQDRDDRVRGARAARHAQSVGRRAHAGRLEQRLGRGGRDRHGERGARHAGDRLDHPAGELLRLRRLQADRRRAQSRRQPRQL